MVNPEDSKEQASPVSPTPSDFSTIDKDDGLAATSTTIATNNQNESQMMTQPKVLCTGDGAIGTAPVTSSPSVIQKSNGSPAKLNPHKKYFFDDGNLWLRVEDVDFKVHRYFFMRDSSKFRALSNGGTLGRTSDEVYPNTTDMSICKLGPPYTGPLVIEHLTSLDFESFLGVLYPTNFGQDEGTSVAYWSSVLQVSTYFELRSIRELSISKLTVIATAVDKVVLGRKFNVTHWLEDAYHTICTSWTHLTKEEGRRLGVDEVTGILEARQRLLWENPKMQKHEQLKIIAKIFGLEAPPDPTVYQAHPSSQKPSSSERAESNPSQDGIHPQFRPAPLPALFSLSKPSSPPPSSADPDKKPSTGPFSFNLPTSPPSDSAFIAPAKPTNLSFNLFTAKPEVSNPKGVNDFNGPKAQPQGTRPLKPNYGTWGALVKLPPT
ncbi:hypothetical protein AX16_008945 [Volvariella volvacea WC 439]|nr:hypothetical protein AX16_008945 [Volvariella volvacea WC 439]